MTPQPVEIICLIASWPSRDEAAGYANAVRQAGFEAYAYACRHCWKWHVGNPPHVRAVKGSA